MNDEITITNTPEDLQKLATFLRQHCPNLLVREEGGWGYASSVTLIVATDEEIEIVDNDNQVVIE